MVPELVAHHDVELVENLKAIYISAGRSFQCDASTILTILNFY
jgi:hypothetical protein